MNEEMLYWLIARVTGGVPTTLEDRLLMALGVTAVFIFLIWVMHPIAKYGLGSSRRRTRVVYVNQPHDQRRGEK